MSSEAGLKRVDSGQRRSAVKKSLENIENQPRNLEKQQNKEFGTGEKDYIM